MTESPTVNRPFWFLDDAFIAEQTGLVRRLGRPVKFAGNPILKPDRPWEGNAVMLYGSVLWDTADNLFKIWYLAFVPFHKEVRNRTLLCYAESRDGIAWTKPNLGLVDYQGSTDNNIFFRLDDAILDSPTVVIDPFNPPEEERFKMVFCDVGRRNAQQHCLMRFASPDGVHWKPLGPIVLSHQAGDVNCLMPDPDHGRWNLYYKHSTHVPRTMMWADSEDFEHWNDHGVSMKPTSDDPPETEFYGMVGFRERGWGVGFLEMFHVLERRLDTQLFRLDEKGKPSRLLPGQTFLQRGALDQWDSAWVFPGNGKPIRYGEEVRICYFGMRTLHWGCIDEDARGDIGAIGLATLRADGYVYLETARPKATLTTVPLKLTGHSICVNADAVGGTLAAELLDETGNVLPGFSVDKCRPLRSDATYFKLNWAGRSKLDDLTGRTLRLRFHLEGDVKLYAFWFSDRPF